MFRQPLQLVRAIRHELARREAWQAHRARAKGERGALARALRAARQLVLQAARARAHELEQDRRDALLRPLRVERLTAARAVGMNGHTVSPSTIALNEWHHIAAISSSLQPDRRVNEFVGDNILRRQPVSDGRVMLR